MNRNTTATATRTTTAIIAAAGLFMPLSPANAQYGASRSAEATNTTQQSNNQNRGMTDEDLADAVREQLRNDAIVPATAVDVETSNQMVYLDGELTTIYAKMRAENLAASVRGVTDIENNITVDPVDVPDSRLRRDIETAFLINPATESFELDVSADDGEVTLAGEVDTAAERQLAYEVAASVAGVKSIDATEVTVDRDADIPAAELRTNVVEALQWDASIGSALIEVDVSEGNLVKLTGTVGSFAEKRAAIDTAREAGARDVDATDLTIIRAEGQRDRLHAGEYEDIAPSSVRAAVKDAIEDEPGIVATAIDVDIDGRTAELDGTVATLHQKLLAAATADNIIGVDRVDNDISIEIPGGDEVSENDIEGNVRRNLRANPVVNDRGLEIEADGNTVALNGEVQTIVERDLALMEAAKALGVKEIDNHLTVEDPVLVKAFDPFVDEVSVIYASDDPVVTVNLTTMKEDWKIAEDIAEELFWSPFVDSNDINVSVVNGVATLTGTVQTPGEANDAIENAYEGGAIVVDNDLNIQYGPDRSDG